MLVRPFFYGFVSEVEVTYPSATLALMARNTLSVDEEIQPNKICKSFRVDGSTMHVHFTASEEKVLRVVMSSFFDMALVVSRTMMEFDSGSESETLFGVGGDPSVQVG
ncbi:unnamed protein product [Choristocarpus tenellus]